MHKKLEAELVSLAHQILQMKDKKDVIKLRDKAKDVYEKLSVLTFIDTYFLTTPNATENKEELINSIDNTVPVKEIAPVKETVVKETIQKEPQVETKKEESTVSEAIEKQNKDTIKAEAEEIVNKIIEQEVTDFKDATEINSEQIAKENTTIKGSLANNEEFKDSIPADVAADLFEKAGKLEQTQKPEKSVLEQEVTKKEVLKQEQKPAQTETKPEVKTSLNDRIFSQKIQIGLNDRIAFVKYLFNFNQEDFNRVLSQLNAFNTETASKHFITNQVKPTYDWSGKEEYEERLMVLIERKFL